MAATLGGPFEAVGDGRASLKYLAPYVFRVAISDRRIVSCDDGQVTFAYRRSGSNHYRKMTVGAFEFIRRFLQHVLPRRFQKVRHYGFLSPNSRHSIEAVRWLVTSYYGLVYRLVAERKPKPSDGPHRVVRDLRRAGAHALDAVAAGGFVRHELGHDVVSFIIPSRAARAAELRLDLRPRRRCFESIGPPATLANHARILASAARRYGDRASRCL